MLWHRKNWPKTKIKSTAWSLVWTISNWTFVFAFASGCAVDHNECTTGTHHCAFKGLCTNTNGSYTCSCPSGYKGNGIRRGVTIGNKVTGSGCSKCLTERCVFVFFFSLSRRQPGTWNTHRQTVLLPRLQRRRRLVQNPKLWGYFSQLGLRVPIFLWKAVKKVEKQTFSCVRSSDDLGGFKGWKKALCFFEL